MYLECGESSSGDPGAAFLGDNREFEQGESVNPKVPDFRELVAWAADDSISDVSKDMYGQGGQVGAGADFVLKGGDCRMKEEAKQSGGKALSLEHAINDVERVEDLLTCWHV